MPQRHRHAVVDFNRAHAENRRFQPAVNRPRPFRADRLASPAHAHDGTRRRAVAIGVEARLHGQADRFPVISPPVKQRSGDNFGIGNRMAPVVRRMLVPAGVNIGEASDVCAARL